MKPLLFVTIQLLLFLYPLGPTEKATFYCLPCKMPCDTIAHADAGNCPHCHMELEKKTPEQQTNLFLNQKNKPKMIAFYLHEGIEILDFAGPAEVFTSAGFDVITVSNTKAPITSQGVFKVIPQYSFEDCPQPDILAVFGGNSSQAVQDEDAIRWIKEIAPNTELIFSVCTGALFLAKAGLLNGHRVTTFHDAIEILKQEAPQADVLTDVKYVDSGKIISTAGVSSGIDGALYLVERLNGKAAARETAYYIEYDSWLIPPIKLPLQKLEEYQGVYEHKNSDGTESKIQLAISPKDSILYALLEDQKVPLHAVSKDTFINKSGRIVFFSRDKNQVVNGYRVEDQFDNRIFKKLSEQVELQQDSW